MIHDGERRVKDDWTALSLSTCCFLLRWWEVQGRAEEKFTLRHIEVEMPVRHPCGDAYRHLDTAVWTWAVGAAYRHV